MSCRCRKEAGQTPDLPEEGHLGSATISRPIRRRRQRIRPGARNCVSGGARSVRPVARRPCPRSGRRAARDQALALQGFLRAGDAGLVVLGVLVDLPEVVDGARRPGCSRRVSMAVIIAWSWLLYLCMPLRPTRCRVGIVAPPARARIVVDVACVVVVVDRVGLGLADHAAVDHVLAASTRPICAISRLASSIRSASGAVHRPSPSKQKYSRP